MLVTDGVFCSSCGCEGLKSQNIKSGLLVVEGKVFDITNFPGYICTYCEEEQIKTDTIKIFKDMLSEGLYEPVDKFKIPVYDFGMDIDITEEQKCNFCSEELNKDCILLPFKIDGRIYCINKVPVKTCNACKEGLFLNNSVMKTINNLHRNIKKQEVNSTGEVECILLECQKK